MAIAKARHQDGSCGGRAHKRAKILLLVLLLSACAHPPKVADRVEEVTPVEKVQPAVKEAPAVDSKPQPAAVEEKAPLPAMPPPVKHDHNIEED